MPSTKKVFYLVRFVFLGILVVIVTFFLYPHQSIQAACPTSFGLNETIVYDGLLTLGNAADSNIYSGSGGCILGSEATIPQAFDEYTQIKSIYYDKSKFPGTKTNLPVGNVTHQNPGGSNVLKFNDNAGTMYNIQGNLTVTTNNPASDVNFAGGKNGIVFVNGNLEIDRNIKYGDSNTGLVFVVSGDVNILQSVQEVDAYIITFGKFCSGWQGPEGTASDPTCAVDAEVEPQLTVKGSIISLSTDAAKSPVFNRTSASPRTVASEVFQYQPKYLVILRNVFSADRIIWSEINQ